MNAGKNVTFCHNRGECHNLDGSYNCTCDPGWDASSECKEGKRLYFLSSQLAIKSYYFDKNEDLAMSPPLFILH